jgi:hypothetical protein
MKHYYIYHIPHFKRKNGKIGKIGCSDEVQYRIEKQGYVFSECEILEIHTDIYVASDRELELQRQYGYPIDHTPYWLAIERRSKGGKIGGRIGGKIGGNRNIETGKIEITWKARRLPITVYRKDNGEYVGTYSSMSECSKQLNVFVSNICMFFKGQTTHVKGYIFKKEAK